MFGNGSILLTLQIILGECFKKIFYPVALFSIQINNFLLLVNKLTDMPVKTEMSNWMNA